MNPRLVAVLIALTAALTACGGGDDEDGDKAGGSKASQSEGGDGGKTGTPAEPATKVIDTGRGSGEFATAAADGRIPKTTVIKLKVTPEPAQKTQVSWTTTCSKGRKANSDNGDYEISKPATTALPKPKKGRTSCLVAVNAQLLGPGKLTIQIIG